MLPRNMLHIYVHLHCILDSGIVRYNKYSIYFNTHIYIVNYLFYDYLDPPHKTTANDNDFCPKHFRTQVQMRLVLLNDDTGTMSESET